MQQKLNEPKVLEIMANAKKAIEERKAQLGLVSFDYLVKIKKKFKFKKFYFLFFKSQPTKKRP